MSEVIKFDREKIREAVEDLKRGVAVYERVFNNGYFSFEDYKDVTRSSGDVHCANIKVKSVITDARLENMCKD